MRVLLVLFGLFLAPLAATAEESSEAIVAGGCFWCVESDFDKVAGVLETVSGYTGGTGNNPTYKTHSATKHIEAVRIRFDPKVITYEQILDRFWRTVDVTDEGGQFCDRGHSYITTVFVGNDGERAIAEASKTAAEASLGQAIVTPIIEASAFWPAEDYHQDYHHKNPLRYTYYRYSCGRDARVIEVWGNQAQKAPVG